MASPPPPTARRQNPLQQRAEEKRREKKMNGNIRYRMKDADEDSFNWSYLPKPPMPVVLDARLNEAMRKFEYEKVNIRFFRFFDAAGNAGSSMPATRAIRTSLSKPTNGGILQICFDDDQIAGRSCYIVDGKAQWHLPPPLRTGSTDPKYLEYSYQEQILAANVGLVLARIWIDPALSVSTYVKPILVVKDIQREKKRVATPQPSFGQARKKVRELAPNGQSQTPAASTHQPTKHPAGPKSTTAEHGLNTQQQRLATTNGWVAAKPLGIPRALHLPPKLHNVRAGGLNRIIDKARDTIKYVRVHRAYGYTGAKLKATPTNLEQVIPPALNAWYVEVCLSDGWRFWVCGPNDTDVSWCVPVCLRSEVLSESSAAYDEYWVKESKGEPRPNRKWVHRETHAVLTTKPEAMMVPQQEPAIAKHGLDRDQQRSTITNWQAVTETDLVYALHSGQKEGCIPDELSEQDIKDSFMPMWDARFRLRCDLPIKAFELIFWLRLDPAWALHPHYDQHRFQLLRILLRCHEDRTKLCELEEKYVRATHERNHRLGNFELQREFLTLLHKTPHRLWLPHLRRAPLRVYLRLEKRIKGLALGDECKALFTASSMDYQPFKLKIRNELPQEMFSSPPWTMESIYPFYAHFITLPLCEIKGNKVSPIERLEQMQSESPADLVLQNLPVGEPLPASAQHLSAGMGDSATRGQEATAPFGPLPEAVVLNKGMQAGCRGIENKKQDISQDVAHAMEALNLHEGATASAMNAYMALRELTLDL